MKKHLYEIKRLDIPAYLKWWFIKYRNAGTLSEVLENLVSPITLPDSLRRKFKIFEIGGNSIQDGEPSPTNEVPIQNVTGDVKVVVENKNLFNYDYLKNYIGTGSVIIENGFRTKKYDTYINVEMIKTFKPGETYTFFFDLKKVGTQENNPNISGRIAIVIDGRVKKYVVDGGVYTIPDNATSVRFRLYGATPANDENYYEFTNIMFVKGQITTKIPYVPHEEQTVTFPLAEGQRLHLTDTIEDKIVQRRKTYEITGEENWVKSGNTTNISFCCYTNSIRPLPKNNGTVGLLNIGKVCNYQAISIYKNAFAYNVGNSHFLKIEKTAIPNWDESLTDAEKVVLFKAYLAQQYANGTPVTLEYELETPLETEFTEAQTTAKAEIDKLCSYKGTTHISSDNEVSPTFKIQYVKEE